MKYKQIKIFILIIAVFISQRPVYPAPNIKVMPVKTGYLNTKNIIIGLAITAVFTAIIKRNSIRKWFKQPNPVPPQPQPPQVPVNNPVAQQPQVKSLDTTVTAANLAAFSTQKDDSQNRWSQKDLNDALDNWRSSEDNNYFDIYNGPDGIKQLNYLRAQIKDNLDYEEFYKALDQYLQETENKSPIPLRQNNNSTSSSAVKPQQKTYPETSMKQDTLLADAVADAVIDEYHAQWIANDKNFLITSPTAEDRTELYPILQRIKEIQTSDPERYAEFAGALEDYLKPPEMNPTTNSSSTSTTTSAVRSENNTQLLSEMSSMSSPYTAPLDTPTSQPTKLSSTSTTTSSTSSRDAQKSASSVQNPKYIYYCVIDNKSFAYFLSKVTGENFLINLSQEQRFLSLPIEYTGEKIFNPRSMQQFADWHSGYFVLYNAFLLIINWKKMNPVTKTTLNDSLNNSKFYNQFQTFYNTVLRNMYTKLTTVPVDDDIIANFIRLGNELLNPDRINKAFYALGFNPVKNDSIMLTTIGENGQPLITEAKDSLSKLKAEMLKTSEPFIINFVGQLTSGQWILIAVLNPTGKPEDTALIILDSQNKGFETDGKNVLVNIISNVFLGTNYR